MASVASAVGAREGSRGAPGSVRGISWAGLAMSLMCVFARTSKPWHSLSLGREEVGSGCVRRRSVPIVEVQVQV